MENIYNNLKRVRVSFKSLILLLSSTQAFLATGLSAHHQQVAFLSYNLGKRYGLDEDSVKRLTLAALVHDVGALSAQEHMEIAKIDVVSNFDSNHATKGAALLTSFKPFAHFAPIIKYHHLPWDDGRGLEYKGEQVPIESHIMCLADQISLKYGREKFIMKKMPEIMEMLEAKRGSVFIPQLVEIMHGLSHKHSFWLAFTNDNPLEQIGDYNLFDTIQLEADDVIDLAHVISQIIDFRSPFTARHSAGVAETATNLARLANFSENEQKMMRIAGYLHDIGKIAIRNEVLEKPGKLTDEEMTEMKAHTYYTARMLNTIPQFAIVNQWAALHHERMDGKGYPFGYTGEFMPLGSRLMAVADVFTAVTEHRPYRDGLDKKDVIKILDNMVEGGALDRFSTDLLIENFDEINEQRIKAQEAAMERFERFMDE